MKTISFNGEFWYADASPLWRRIANWCIWVGGWSIWRKHGGGIGNLAPVSLLGHRVTFQSWGLSVRYAGDWLVLVWKSGRPSGSKLPYAFISRNGTPQNAHTWLLNPPLSLVRAAAVRSAHPVEMPRGN